MIKTFIAYALVVIGLPVLVGLFFGSIVSIPLSALLLRRTKARLPLLLYLDVFNGIGAVVAAALLFRVFALPLAIPVLIIMIAWVTLYFRGYGQSPRAWFSCVAGMLIGWLTIPRLFPF